MPTGVSPYRRFDTVVNSNVSNDSNLIGNNTGNATLENEDDFIILGDPLFTDSDIRPFPNTTITGVEVIFKSDTDLLAPSSGNSFGVILRNNALVTPQFDAEIKSGFGWAIQNVANSNNGYTPEARVFRVPDPISGNPQLTNATDEFTPDNIISNLEVKFEIGDDTPDFSATLIGTTSDPYPAVRVYYTYTVPSKIHITNTSKLSLTGNSKIIVSI